MILSALPSKNKQLQRIKFVAYVTLSFNIFITGENQYGSRTLCQINQSGT